VFKKVLIANRAIPALRSIQTFRELKIKSVVPYSEADRDSLPVLFADEAVCIGPPAPADSYANISRLLSAAEISGCDAVYPGWGFLACDAEFADATLTLGKTFIGPSPEPLRLLRDRLTLRQVLNKVDVPILPGSDASLTNPAAAVEICQKLGLPCAVKPVSNRISTLRIIRKEKDIEYQVRMCQAEVRARTGTDQVYLERFVPAARKVEVHLLATGERTFVLNDWEVMLQTGGEKILAIAPAQGITPAQRQQIYSWATAATTALQITGSVTIQFLIEKDGKTWFSQVNPGVCSLHPLTEVRTGIDIVEEQVKIAAHLAGSSRFQVLGSPNQELITKNQELFAVATQGFAENPDAEFEPSPGIVVDLHLPGGPGIRVDSHLYTGWTIPGDYDLHIATITAWGSTLRGAVNRLVRGLTETTISGVATNLNFILALIKTPGFGSEDWCIRELGNGKMGE
jgi:acetyl-CoA carboxylase biotin carboxylase subunit